jgi:uncharacterized membrane protein
MEFLKLNLTLEKAVFAFFFFSFSGWIGETIMESTVRRKFVNKGFFKGPYVPIHGIGAFAVYILLFPVKHNLLLVYVFGVLLTTILEYIAALLLEKVFNKKCWDYDTYPFTKWCNYKKRIALTTSLFFGLVVLCLVCFYWDFFLWVTDHIGNSMLFQIDILLCVIFITDMVYTFRKYLWKRQNEK